MIRQRTQPKRARGRLCEEQVGIGSPRMSNALPFRCSVPWSILFRDNHETVEPGEPSTANGRPRSRIRPTGNVWARSRRDAIQPSVLSSLGKPPDTDSTFSREVLTYRPPNGCQHRSDDGSDHDAGQPHADDHRFGLVRVVRRDQTRERRKHLDAGAHRGPDQRAVKRGGRHQRAISLDLTLLQVTAAQCRCCDHRRPVVRAERHLFIRRSSWNALARASWQAVSAGCRDTRERPCTPVCTGNRYTG